MVGFRFIVLTVLLVEVVAISIAGASHHLRAAEKQVATVFQHASGEAVLSWGKSDPIIGDSPFNVPKEKQTQMDMINKFRAQVCANMKEEHGIKFDTFEKCHAFMKEACRPGKDKRMDGDRKEITSGEGYCKEYFSEAENKAEKASEDEDKIAAAHGPAPAPGAHGPGPAPSDAAMPAPAAAVPAPAAAVAAQAPAVAADGKAAGGIPAPAPGGSPSAAGGPFTPGISRGKPSGKIPKDEAWYYKKDGRSLKDRLHMDASLGLPEHGYWGKLVEHEDMDTSTEDWGKEYTNRDSFDDFCSKHHDNSWCEEHHSKSYSKRSGLVASVVVLLGVLACRALMVL